MEKFITITITDRKNEYTTDFIMENVSDFKETVDVILNDLDICY